MVMSLRSPPHEPWVRLSRLLRWLVWLGLGAWVLALALYAIGLVGDDRLAVPLALVRSMALTQPLFSLHTATGGLALILLWVQLAPWARRAGSGHRLRGRAYAGACGISALASLPVAWHSPGGPWATAGLWLLAAMWLAALVPLVASARQRHWIRHRAWVWRHGALTCAALVLRGLQLVDGPWSYATATWLSWSLPLAGQEVVRAVWRRYKNRERHEGQSRHGTAVGPAIPGHEPGRSRRPSAAA